MSEFWEKIIFGFMGAVTAVVVGLAVYSEEDHVRAPASQDSGTTHSAEKPESLYFYYFD